jgi:hypothetical protein
MESTISFLEKLSGDELGFLFVAFLLLVVIVRGVILEFFFYKKNGWNFSIEIPKRGWTRGFLGTSSQIRLPVPLRIFVVQPLIVVGIFSAIVLILFKFGEITLAFGR